MTDLKPPYCSEHNILMVWTETDFPYEEEGVQVTVRHVPAWVCPKGDDVAFAPGVMDDLVRTIRDLIKVAKSARKNQIHLPVQEFLVRVEQ